MIPAANMCIRVVVAIDTPEAVTVIKKRATRNDIMKIYDDDMRGEELQCIE